jgi:hypothetical protein
MAVLADKWEEIIQDSQKMSSSLGIPVPCSRIFKTIIFGPGVLQKAQVLQYCIV